MACRKDTKKWQNAMAKARRLHPNYGTARTQKVAGAILGGKKK